MTKIIGREPLKSFSQDLFLAAPIRAQDLPELLKIPKELAEATIIVRNHQKLDNDAMIDIDDEIYLFMAVMGG